MKQDILKDYQNWAEYVMKELNNNRTWIKQYKEYAQFLLKNEKDFINARSRFRKRGNFDFYLTIGKVKKENYSFDIRYLGQSIGTINANKANISLVVDKEKAATNQQYFGYPGGSINVLWSHSEKGQNKKANSYTAKDFRDFFNKNIDPSKQPRQKEHMVESALFSEFEKKKSINKTFPGVQPIKYANTRIHMKTALKASASKDNLVSISETGGEIDLLCRWHNGSQSKLLAIEVKDENVANETFDKTMKQAISYAVFLIALIRSDAGNAWLKVLGMENQYKDKIVIDAVVAMPKNELMSKPSYCGDILTIGNDEIELHYIAITNYDNKTVKFEHSFKQ